MTACLLWPLFQSWVTLNLIGTPGILRYWGTAVRMTSSCQVAPCPCSARPSSPNRSSRHLPCRSHSHHLIDSTITSLFVMVATIIVILTVIYLEKMVRLRGLFFFQPALRRIRRNQLAPRSCALDVHRKTPQHIGLV